MIPPSVRSVLIICFGLALAISISGTLIVGVILLIDSAFRWKNQERGNRPKTYLEWPLFFYFVWGLLSSLSNQSIGFGKMFSSQSAFLLFYLIVYGISKEEILKLGKWFCIASVLMGTLALFQEFSGLVYSSFSGTYSGREDLAHWPSWILNLLATNNGRSVATRSHPLTFAEGLIVPFFLVLSWILFQLKKGKNRRVLLPSFGALLMILLGIIFAEGRAVWLGILIGIGVYSFNLPRTYGKKIIFVFGVAIVVAAFVFPGLRGRFLSIFHPSQGTVSDQQSKQARFELWKESLSEAQNKMIIGYGVGGIKLKVADPYTKEDRIWNEPHNIFLQVLLERGIIGLILFLWILVVAIFSIFSLENPWRGTYMACMVAFGIAGLTESWVVDKEIELIFWAFIGSIFHFQGADRHA